MGSVVRVDKMTFDVFFLSIGERVQKRRVLIIKRAKWGIHERSDDMICGKRHCSEL